MRDALSPQSTLRAAQSTHKLLLCMAPLAMYDFFSITRHNSRHPGLADARMFIFQDGV